MGAVRWQLPGTAALLLTLACGQQPLPAEAAGACVGPRDEPLQPIMRCEVDVGSAEPTAGSLPVRVGLFLLTTASVPVLGWGEEDAAELIRDGIGEAGPIFAPCGMHIEPVVAHVVAAPVGLLDIVGNAEDAWGGDAPASAADADRYNYRQGERLSEQPRQLFGYRLPYIGDNVIAVYVVDDIIYHAAQQPRPAGGLSYPPIVYHHHRDYPFRNSVLVASGYREDGALPSRVNGRTLAHELGHMLLDTAQHDGEPGNLMVSGVELTAQQCAIMRSNLERLYGDEVVVDPLAGQRSP